MRRLLVLLVLAVGFLLGCGAGGGHRLVATGRCTIGGKLQVVGKGLGGSEGGASWSPDSRKLAFPSGYHSPVDAIYTVNIDGTDERRLTHHIANDAWPTWSPDGKQIAFVSDVHNFTDDIYLMNTDGRDLRQLTKSSDYPGATAPAWSPDGRQIAFIDQNYALEVMWSDGSHRRVVNSSGTDGDPAWSPDGRKIVFDQRVNRRIELYVVGEDGSGLRQLTRRGANAFPSWSPDGRRIVFDRALPAKNSAGLTIAAYVMNANGTQQQRLTPSKKLGTPLWAPNGRMIAFEGSRLEITSIRCG